MIKKIDFDDIPKNIIHEAKKLNITFLKSSEYYCYIIEYKIVAIAAIKNFKKFSLLKSSFVLPPFRRQGIYKKLVLHRLEILKNIMVIETRAKKYNSLYLQSLGFKIVKKYKIADHLRLIR